MSDGIKKRVEYFTAALILLSFVAVTLNFSYIFLSKNLFTTGFSIYDFLVILALANLVFILLVYLYFYLAKWSLQKILLQSESDKHRYLLSTDDVVDEDVKKQDNISEQVDLVWKVLIRQFVVLMTFSILTNIVLSYDASQNNANQSSSVHLGVVGYFIIVVTLVIIQSRHLIRMVQTDKEKQQLLLRFLIVLLSIQPITIVLLIATEPIYTAVIGFYLQYYNFYIAIDIVYCLFILMLIPLYLTIYSMVNNADKPAVA